MNTFDRLYLLTSFLQRAGFVCILFVEFVLVYLHANIFNKILLYQAHTENIGNRRVYHGLNSDTSGIDVAITSKIRNRNYLKW